MFWCFDHPASDKDIMVDIVRGSYDGSYYSSSVLESIDFDKDRSAAIANAVLCGTKGQRGVMFKLPRIEELRRRIVTPPGLATIDLESFRLKDILETDETIYLIAESVN